MNYSEATYDLALLSVVKSQNRWQGRIIRLQRYQKKIGLS